MTCSCLFKQIKHVRCFPTFRHNKTSEKPLNQNPQHLQKTLVDINTNMSQKNQFRLEKLSASYTNPLTQTRTINAYIDVFLPLKPVLIPTDICAC